MLDVHQQALPLIPTQPQPCAGRSDQAGLPSFGGIGAWPGAATQPASHRTTTTSSALHATGEGEPGHAPFRRAPARRLDRSRNGFA